MEDILINKDIDSFFNIVEQKEIDTHDIIIGIDLGTSNSCCSVWTGDKHTIIVDEYNNHTIPSYVSFDEEDNIYIGNYNKQNRNPIDYFYESKRLIGRLFNDEIVENEKKYLTYQIGADNNNNICLIKHNKQQLTPEFISSCILSSIKHNAEIQLKQSVKKAIITVPAYFNDKQRQATKNAALIAGLECELILCEPVAAALAYGLNHLNKNNYNILVYDLGGGTLDVSLIELNSGIFEVKGTNGNMHIGGIDFDNIIYDYCLKIFKINNPNFNSNEISNDNKLLLKNLSENAKILLSTEEKTNITIENFWNNKKINIILTKLKLNELCNNIIKLCIQPINNLLEKININKNNINEIILVGGMTKMPIIKETINKYFQEKIVINSSINPDEIVAIGASIQGYLINYPDTHFSESITLLNTTSLSLGIEMSSGIIDILIPKNSFFPLQKQKIYTNVDNSSELLIKLYEGERSIAVDNYLVGDFIINIEPKPKGFHKIEITITIDLNNIISVEAKNLNNKNEYNNIKINKNKNNLSQEKINKIIQKSEKYKLIDKQNKRYKILQSKLLSIINIFNNRSKDDLQNIDLNSLLPKIKKANELLNLSKENSNTLYFDQLQTIYNDINNNYYTIITDSFDNNNLNTIETLNNNSTGVSIYQDEKLNNINNLNNINDNNDVNIIINDTDNINIINEYTTKWFKILEELNTEKDNLIDVADNNKYLVNKIQFIIDISDFINEYLLDLQLDNNITIEKCKSYDISVNNYYLDYEQYDNKNLDNTEQLSLICGTLKNSILSNNNIIDNKYCTDLIILINSAEKYLEEVNIKKNIIDNFISEIDLLCNLIIL